MWRSNEDHTISSIFRFERAWLLEEGFKGKIAEQWMATAPLGSATQTLAARLAALRGFLMAFRRQIRLERDSRRTAALETISRLDQMEYTRELSREEVEERRHHQNVIQIEDRKVEVQWRQRSRQTWLREGDANTRFFHLYASGRRRANRIDHIGVQGRIVTGHAQIGTAIAAHFKEATRRPPPPRWRWTDRGLPHLSNDKISFLVQEIKEAEVTSGRSEWGWCPWA